MGLQKYSLEDILSCTSNFCGENLITEGVLGKMYKGQLLQDGNLMHSTVLRLDHTYWQGDELETEILMLQSLKHKNIASIFGYCDESNEKIIVYEQAFHGTLDKHLSDPTLTWSRRLQICFGVACAISYIHYDVIHCDINSSKIFLDEDWEPKIYGFELSTKYPESRRHHLLFSRHFDTNNLTPKYDVYLFGVLLFEVLCGRKPIITIDGVQEELDGIIDPSLRKQMDTQMLQLFTSIAYKCLNKQLGQRPPMDRIITELKEVLELHREHENLLEGKEYSKAADEDTSLDNLKTQFLKIPLSEIRMATNNFNEAYLVGAGGFAEIYKAKLDVVDIQSSSSMEGKSRDELPKISKTVAIKRISNRADVQGKQGFFTELESLTRCKHPNIVCLLGFSTGNNEYILVYEYALNGSLSDYFEAANLTDEYVGSDYWSRADLNWARRLQICLDIANGIHYLHTNMENKPCMIHRDIKSGNIMLDENMSAKLADFGLSKLHPMNNQASTIFTVHIAGTEVYIDPEYMITGKYKRETDIYSFGVVLFEVLSGRLAYDSIYLNENDNGLAAIARRRFNEGTLKELIDPKLTEEDHDQMFTLNSRLNSHSFDTFSKIAYQCLAETQDKRPTIEVIIEQLQNALNLQGFKPKEGLPILNNFSLLSATFCNENLITEGAVGKVYKGQLIRNGTTMNFTVRRLDCVYGQGDELQTEMLRLKSLEHKNIISILGHYDENNERIVIYEQAFHGTLDQHLSSPTLTWSRRLKICLGVARALNFIHYDVIHCDISSSKIFLDEDWEPKIYGFELSTEYPQSWRHRLLFSRHFGTNNMSPKYDVYLFGVLLLEVLCGRKLDITNDVAQEELDKIIDPNLGKEMNMESFTQFKELAYKCLDQQLMQRPTMDQIVKQLEEVSELQLKHANLGYSKVVEEGTSLDSLKEFFKVPLSEIQQATKNFNIDYFIGSGGYADVYKAELNVLDIPSLSSMKGKRKEELSKIRKLVAIKRIKDEAKMQGKQGFFTEIKLLTSCKHQNVVTLLGFSEEDDEFILVYEYASNGSVGDYLESQGKTVNILTWSQRLQICLDAAKGIDYLHTNMEGKPRIIHRDIKSDNILLDENMKAKVGDFGLSKFQPMMQKASTIYSKTFAGTEVYMDPEYASEAKYKRESDVYSFGVVLFEVLSGRLAYDHIYTSQNRMGLAPIARRRFNERTLKELIDPKMTEEDGDHIFTLNKGPNQNSLNTFSEIAYRCLAETQAKRPTMDVVIKELQEALKLQGDTTVLIRFLLDDIVSATKNFAEAYYIGSDENGMVYKAELDHFRNNSLLATQEKNNGEPAEKHITVAIKRIVSGKDEQGRQEFFEQLEMCSSYKHPNTASLLGFCDEGDEMILVYEHTSNRSLDDYLKSIDNMDKFTWTHRLRTCLQIARGLNHLHTNMINPQKNSDIRSANIMLDKNWEAKIAYFGISRLHPTNQEKGMKVYEDPEYKTGKLNRGSDIYSFGVVLFEIFCGRVAYDPIYRVENDTGLAASARQCLKDGTIHSLMDLKLKEETDHENTFSSNKGPNRDSLDTFLKIAYQCLGEAAKRPTMEIVIKELEMALKFHEQAGGI